ncbi:MAG TPA: YeeE/YedE thiosulfate transporter family protein [Myxococcales bacterium]|nr:YeeE/YedE thiosulfate transporter family protein [Myxococcales bacterium]
MLHLLGGVLIGLAASALLLLNGRVLGITGIVSGLLGPDARWRALFVAGMLLGGAAVALALPGAFASALHQRTPVLIAGGLLVGFGTRLGNGCTSGHGVCGMARLSPRSLAATAVFIGTGALTVFALRHLS